MDQAWTLSSPCFHHTVIKVLSEYTRNCRRGTRIEPIASQSNDMLVTMSISACAIDMQGYHLVISTCLPPACLLRLSFDLPSKSRFTTSNPNLADPRIRTSSPGAYIIHREATRWLLSWTSKMVFSFAKASNAFQRETSHVRIR